MSIKTADDAVVHALHGNTFSSFVAPSLGSTQLCAWRLDVAPDSVGVAHRVSHEEVLLVLAGELRAVVDGVSETACAGDVVTVAANGRVRVDAGPSGASAWVVTSVGLAAVTDDGQRIEPPWTR